MSERGELGGLDGEFCGLVHFDGQYSIETPCKFRLIVLSKRRYSMRGSCMFDRIIQFLERSTEDREIAERRGSVIDGLESLKLLYRLEHLERRSSELAVSLKEGVPPLLMETRWFF